MKLQSKKYQVMKLKYLKTKIMKPFYNFSISFRAMLFAMCLLQFNIVWASGIEWSAVNGYLNFQDGINPLTGGTNGTTGCFVQLIWVGSNGSIDDATNSGDGTTGDDVVVAYAYVGAGGAAGDDGWFDGQQVAEGGDVQDGRIYYLRT